jgi:hypothetical protein
MGSGCRTGDQSSGLVPNIQSIQTRPDNRGSLPGIIVAGADHSPPSSAQDELPSHPPSSETAGSFNQFHFSRHLSSRACRASVTPGKLFSQSPPPFSYKRLCFSRATLHRRLTGNVLTEPPQANPLEVSTRERKWRATALKGW